MFKCDICGTEKGKYFHFTNGDSMGDAKYVDLKLEEGKEYCSECVKQAPDYTEEIDRRFKERGMCGFKEAYIGRCREMKPCKKHGELKCFQCGEPATRNCTHTGMLVCGVPCCDKHDHEH